MIPKYLSPMWEAIAPALGNHLWQSTLFAAGLLTLILRKNHARARYWLWLAASVKFLIPFSLLVSVGNHLSWSRSPAGTPGGLYFAMEQVGQPFTQPTSFVVSQATPSPVSASLIPLLPGLLAVWLCGFLVIFLVWYVRWRRISSTMREAVPLIEGREVEALRRLENIAGMRQGIEMFLSRSSLEPGVFGITRPVLVWPEGISERLENAHLNAILAHELWHVRRRDNLAAAMHMLVEAIFWFHPLVWWLGARLIEERERACDQEVLELGSERQVYAESILKVCEFCLGSPLACVSGVTGADLKKRIVHIMSEHVVRKLNLASKLLLGAVGAAAVVLPIVFGLANATPGRAQSQPQNMAPMAPAYESVSIKESKPTGDVHMVRLMFTPDGFSARGITLQTLIREAYGVQDTQISGAPGWVTSEKYDIDVKRDKSLADELHKLGPEQAKPVVQNMLRALLADRFKLTLHLENKDLQQYSMVAAENGPKLQQSKTDDTYPSGMKGPDGVGHPGMMQMDIGRGRLTGQGLSMTNLAELLSRQLGSPVVDKTGLTGKYDFTLQWTPDESQIAVSRSMGGSDNPPPLDASGPSIFTAVQEQLGLELKPQTGPVQILVVDHVEPTSEN